VGWSKRGRQIIAIHAQAGGRPDPNLLPPTKLRRMVFPARTSSSHGIRKSGSVVYTPTRDVNIEQLMKSVRHTCTDHTA